MSERKLTYDFLLGLANHNGLILEKINTQYDGVKYRYQVTSNEAGVSEDCRNLEEVLSFIHEYPKQYK